MRADIGITSLHAAGFDSAQSTKEIALHENQGPHKTPLSKQQPPY